MNATYTLTPIGFLQSGYKEKFGIPRQSGLVSNLATIKFVSPYNCAEAFRGLEDYSHIWIECIFHKNLRNEWKSTVRPPRLGGNEKRGVFATRSPFRPNGVGLSVVKLVEIKQSTEGVCITIEGADLVDGTPIIDIKPYLPYVDAIPDAQGGFATTAPNSKLKVEWHALALKRLEMESKIHPDLKGFIESTLALDPRPAYHQGSDKKYGIHFYEFNVVWSVQNGVASIHAIERFSKRRPSNEY
jgi:tRNA-Thr(GGU) m(6)t(6)A37 methyltransferase TsaA